MPREVRPFVVVTEAGDWQSTDMTAKEVHERSGTPSDIAERIESIWLLVRSVNRWAQEYGKKLPRGSRQPILTYVTLLRTELLNLKTSLKKCDPKLARALERRRPD